MNFPCQDFLVIAAVKIKRAKFALEQLTSSLIESPCDRWRLLKPFRS